VENPGALTSYIGTMRAHSNSNMCDNDLYVYLVCLSVHLLAPTSCKIEMQILKRNVVMEVER